MHQFIGNFDVVNSAFIADNFLYKRYIQIFVYHDISYILRSVNDGSKNFIPSLLHYNCVRLTGAFRQLNAISPYGFVTSLYKRSI